MNWTELLKGKYVNVMTDMNVEVKLQIHEVEQNQHSKDLEPATQANDWWPRQETWTTFTVHFTNGASKTYSSINELDIIDPAEEF